MKKIFILSLLFFAVQISSFAQTTLPDVIITDLLGDEVKASELTNDGKPIIISFWATWCKPCISELDAINDEYEDWQEETGVKLIAISIDDERSAAMVKTMSQGRDWAFDIYLDKNQDLKRVLNVVNVPHTFLLNGKGEVVWQRNSYVPGAEEELLEEINKLVTQK